MDSFQSHFAQYSTPTTANMTTSKSLNNNNNETNNIDSPKQQQLLNNNIKTNQKLINKKLIKTTSPTTTKTVANDSFAIENLTTQQQNMPSIFDATKWLANLAAQQQTTKSIEPQKSPVINGGADIFDFSKIFATNGANINMDLNFDLNKFFLQQTMAAAAAAAGGNSRLASFNVNNGLISLDMDGDEHRGWYFNFKFYVKKLCRRMGLYTCLKKIKCKQ